LNLEGGVDASASVPCRPAVADDPVVSFGVRFSGQARNFADGNGSLILIGAGAIVALAVCASLWQRRRAVSTGLVRQ
jgi:hypothetical protein